MKTKLLAICLSVFILFTMLPICVVADDGIFTIASDEDWLKFCENAQENKNATVQITSDFDMGGKQFSEVFAGTIYGNGHTISYPTEGICALFGDFAGEAYDLVLGQKDVKYATRTSTGAFAARVSGDATLFDITNNLYIVVGATNINIGGLIGEISGNDIEVVLTNCQNGDGKIEVKQAGCAGGALIGAVTGENVTLTLSRCENSGTLAVNGTISGISGMIGCWEEPNGTLTFDRCINNTSVSGVIGAVTGFLALGPNEAQDNTFSVSFLKCANKGTLGGKAVLKNTTPLLCNAAGFINGTVANKISFIGCYNVGNISVTYDLRSGYNGGPTVISAAGFASGCTANEFVIKNSYMNATVTDADTDSDYVIQSGRFTLKGNEYIATNAIDLAKNDATLEYVASLDNKTLFNADGTLIWETTKTLTTAHGAAIRTDLPTGLRFSTTISKAEYEELCSTYKSVKFGTIIAPAAYVEQAGEFTKDALDNLGYTKNYLDIGGVVIDDGETVSFNGCIVNIYEQHYELEYAGRGYILLEDYNGNETVIYADYENEYYVRSVYFVAVKALGDSNNKLSNGAIEEIEKIVAHVESK